LRNLLARRLSEGFLSDLKAGCLVPLLERVAERVIFRSSGKSLALDGVETDTASMHTLPPCHTSA
jgi:hypothetical protein